MLEHITRKRQNTPGKLIITRFNDGSFEKHRTRQQIIPANPKAGTPRRVILHYDKVIRKTGKPTQPINKRRK